MIKTKPYLPLLLALILLMAGCGRPAALATDIQEDTRPETNVATPDNQANTPAEMQTSSESGVLECNWILEVDDTVENETDGVKHIYHLVLFLDKKGGTDKLGAYTGKIYLYTEQNLSSVQDEVFEDDVALAGGNVIESQADAAVINIVTYAGDTFAQFDFTKDSPDAPLAPLAPVGEYDAMALEKPELSHRQQYGVDMIFEDDDHTNLNKDKVFNTPMTFKILIVGADVNVYIPALKLSKAFKGTITGTPLS